MLWTMYLYLVCRIDNEKSFDDTSNAYSTTNFEDNATSIAFEFLYSQILVSNLYSQKTDGCWRQFKGTESWDVDINLGEST